ncbi:CopG family transcriptional regulator [Rathayibacter sp. Leaf248]|uniref:CopG family transcriptional regulator n=1 Tax=Rathayibacter sp. Leaf248 TaxID=2876555 RepID=UPI001E2DBFCA|nr:CopG family transcriptional regulator [Rathayibacter sp. Leaf248]
MAMTLRLTDEQERALAALADSQGISKQEATVRAILEAADRRVQRADVAELSSRGRERYAALHDRLAQ